MNRETIETENDLPLQENSMDFDDNLLETDKDEGEKENEPISSSFFSSNSVFCSIINICSSAFGAGCFSYPKFIETTGIINSLIIFLIIAGSIYYSLELLRSFIVETKYSSFSVMTKTVLGKKWLIVYSITIFILFLSVNINYININYSIFKTLFSKDDKNIYIFGAFFLIVTSILEILLCIFTSNTKKVHLISMIIVIIFFIFIIILIIGGIQGLKDFSSDKFSSEKFFNPFENKKPYEIFFEIVNTSIMFIYGLAYHSTFPTFLGNVSQNNHTKSKIITGISFGIICLSYLLISFFGYLFKKVVPDILFLEKTETKDKDFITIFSQVIAFLMLFGLIPLRYICIRDGYKCLIGNKKFTKKIDIILTIICLLIANIIVYLDTFETTNTDQNSHFNIFEAFNNFFGGLLCVIICFLLPVINYAAINGKTKKRSIIGYVISVFYILLGLSSVCYAFLKV